jgi:molybdate transport system ATP-binding protein
MIRAAFQGRLGRFALDAEFAVPSTGVTGLFGPSGSGKSTVLRCLAGLQHLRTGSCTIDGEIWQDGAIFRPAHRRPVGYVFQEPSLFPHLSVRRNLLYGAKRRPPIGGRATIGLDEVVDLLGLARLLDRSPRNLSGGERQRVAIGRALLSQPKLLLMDEPLSALDRVSKDEILPFLETLHETLSLPVIYVSHDMAELERLADHLVLMESGRVIGSGPLAALQSDPSLPLASARDAAVTLDAVVTGYDRDDGLLVLDVAGARFLALAPPSASGEARRFSVVAADVSLACQVPQASSILNILHARVLDVMEAEQQSVTVVLGLSDAHCEVKLLARVTRRSWRELGLAIGMDVHAQVKSVALAPGRRRSH